MSWRLKKKYQGLLAEERGTVRKDWGGKIAFALVYPNTYAVGMSNLGFQTIYRHLNALPDVVCERVFLPDPEDIGGPRRTEGVPISLESFRPLSDFHMVGFSVTYEGDYVNMLRLLALARIPLRAGDRRPHDPLVLMGGVCAFSNPEPVAPFMDFIVVGGRGARRRADRGVPGRLRRSRPAPRHARDARGCLRAFALRGELRARRHRGRGSGAGRGAGDSVEAPPAQR